MGLFLRQDEERSEIQSKVAAELQERLRNTPVIEPDEVTPAMLDGSHTTRKAGMVIAVLLVLLVLAIIAMVIKLSL